MYYSNNYYGLTVPPYSRVGERRAYGETEKLDPNKPKNSWLRRETQGCST